MRRLLSAILVGFLATAVLVATPVSASATTITPTTSVVEDAKSLPSVVRKGLTSAGGIGDENIKVMAWLYQQVKTATVTPPPTTGTAPPVKPPTPITQPANYSKVAGGTAMFAFQGGWAVGLGGLELYGQTTGAGRDGIFCGQPEWWQAASSFITMGFAPDCKSRVDDPDTADVILGGHLSFNGYSITFKEHIFKNWGGDKGWVGTYCYNAAGSLLADHRIEWRNLPAQTLYGWSCSPVTDRPYSISYQGDRRSLVPYPVVINNSTGQVVASASEPQELRGIDRKRTPSCSITWDDGSTTSGEGIQYTEADGFPASSKGMGCKNAWDAKPGAGLDTLPRSIGVDSTDDAGAKTEISRQQVPEYTEEQKNSLTTPAITEGLKLWKGTTSCMTWAADCASWWSNTDQGTKPGTGQYRCTFNTAQVALAECGIYRHTFDTRTETPTITDPVTGEKGDWANKPVTTKPEQGNSINPGTGPGTGSSPGDQCMAQWSAAPNPIDWILHPVKCALVWAFVPRSAEVNKVTNGLTKAWELTILGKVINTLGAWQFAPPGNGCEGVNVAISQVWPKTSDFRILNACAGQPLAPIASLSSVVLGIVAVLGSIWSVTRSVGGVVGFTGLSGGGSSDL